MSDLLGGDFASFTSGRNNNDDIDFDAAASAFPDISLDGDIPSGPSGGGGDDSGFSFDDFDAAPPMQTQTAVKVTGDDDIEKFESDFPEIDMPQQAPSRQYSAPTFAPVPQPSTLSSTPILTQTIQEDEPEVIRAWREKQQAEIKARDEASKRRRDETISTAERDIEEFYENYATKKEKAIRENKNTESEFQAEQQASLSSGTTWERICTLVELQNSQSKTIARTGAGTTDLTRFKEVLLRLKREGDKAPGAAGY
ncbi:clathrin light chain-domain-containing protein [Crepidotus variabilis]|uniref:Clathrin light chain n=1 Tax=Crepidotus variabilis TaxID=179855 RepID=A0A9P6EIQ0_9AGAR|nr:clathrin light chain-domain-containing protein [Crepidotus variabilis]